MGIEYRICFAFSDVTQVERLLHSMASFSRFEAISALYEFRDSHNSCKMPDAFVKIELNGLYVCNNGGSGQKILEELYQQITGLFGSSTLEEL